jgi:hypothetical protein
MTESWTGSASRSFDFGSEDSDPFPNRKFGICHLRHFMLTCLLSKFGWRVNVTKADNRLYWYPMKMLRGESWGGGGGGRSKMILRGWESSMFLMSKDHCERHALLCLVSCITEHQTLYKNDNIQKKDKFDKGKIYPTWWKSRWPLMYRIRF